MHSHSFLNMILDALARSAVYRAVGTLVHGHTVAASLLICAALVGVAWVGKRIANPPRRRQSTR